MAVLIEQKPQESAYSTLRLHRKRTLSLLGRLLQVRLAGVGIVVVVALVLLALTADLISPYKPDYQDYTAVLQAPSRAHLMGTDELGRDVLSRVIYGSRVSLEVGLVAVGIAAVAGIALGLLGGFVGGKLDEVLMRAVDSIYSFPAILLALAITAALGPGIGNVMIAIGVVNVPVFARLVRAQALSVREREFVLAARVAGAHPVSIMLRHVWPNVTAPIIVQASLSVSLAIISETSLSFLGVGVQPPTPSWGSMLHTGTQYMENAPWLSIFPGLAIFVTVLGLNFMGDGLRVVLDPRLRQRGSA